MNRMKWLVYRMASMPMAMVSLGAMMFLVFFGTLAQVHIGTFQAQQSYFNSILVWGEPFGFPMPILPGGLIVGGFWFLNLLCSFVVRFQFRARNVGIIISHCGLLVLLIGQGLTQLKSQESLMAIEIGHTTNYSESSRDTEMVFIDVSDAKEDRVVTIPYSIFSKASEIRTPLLPFEVKIHSFYPNADLGMVANGEIGAAEQGLGSRVRVQERPMITTDDQPNTVTAVIEIVSQGQSLGTWLVTSGLMAKQSFFIQGREFEAAIRHKRTYYPFQLTLKEFRHDKYAGTEIPKNFSSLVRLKHDERKEDRDVLIYMNHPLRYDGKTFYQSSFGKNDTLSILQVVKNPFWLAPYIACVMVVLDLAIQFLSHLVLFLRQPR